MKQVDNQTYLMLACHCPFHKSGQYTTPDGRTYQVDRDPLTREPVAVAVYLKGKALAYFTKD